MSATSESSVATMISLNRIILYGADVQMLTELYRAAFGLSVVEEIKDEWAVLQVGPCQLALHRAGQAFRVADVRSAGIMSNAKIVMAVHGDLDAVRRNLLALGVPMGEIKSYPGFTGPLCDGCDPEGNVFQLTRADEYVAVTQA